MNIYFIIVKKNKNENVHSYEERGEGGIKREKERKISYEVTLKVHQT